MPTPALPSPLLERLRDLSAKLNRTVSIMEVCGTHTMAIHRCGIRSLLPANVRLISGPGCPVCVTSASDIDRMIGLSADNERIITTFGDMIRVPGSSMSLQTARSRGARVRVVYSPMDALKIAMENRSDEVVFLAVGFETTAPGIAAALIEAQRLDVENFCIASVLKQIPPALEALLSSPKTAIDGLLCPGHVSVIIGSRAYESVSRVFRLPCAIAGFAGEEILDGLVCLLEQIHTREISVCNRYSAWVKPEGNTHALNLMRRVFEPCNTEWRGLGMIPNSGLALNPEFERFDAFRRFAVPDCKVSEVSGCRCGDVLQGVIEPSECGLFGTACTPEDPVGPCMVSSEGACAAAQKYQE